MTDNYQSTGERPEIHGAFKVLLWFIAIVTIINVPLTIFGYRWFSSALPSSKLFMAVSIFFCLMPLVIVVMAFLSLRKRRGDTIYLLRAFVLFMILGTLPLFWTNMSVWMVVGRLGIWTSCLMYLIFSKQVKQVFPIEERHSSPILRLILFGLSVLYVLFNYRVVECLVNGVPLPDIFYEKVEIFIDESTLKENEYSDGLIRLAKPAGLKCGTHWIDDKDVITLFDDDCSYLIHSDVYVEENRLDTDSLLEELTDEGFKKYPGEVMSDNSWYLPDGNINAHRKCMVYSTEPYPTMVDMVLLEDCRTPKYCVVYGVYEQGTGSHTMDIVEAIRFR